MVSAKRQSFRVTIATVPHIEVMVFRSSLPGTKAHPHRWKVKVIQDVPCAKTGEPGLFGVDHEHWCVKPPTAAKVAKWAREAVLASLEHEVDEGLRVDGKRYREPHKKKARK